MLLRRRRNDSTYCTVLVRYKCSTSTVLVLFIIAPPRNSRKRSSPAVTNASLCYLARRYFPEARHLSATRAAASKPRSICAGAKRPYVYVQSVITSNPTGTYYSDSATGRLTTLSSSTPLSPSMQVSLWMQRWQHRLSTWLHVSLSQQLLRLYGPAGTISASL